MSMNGTNLLFEGFLMKRKDTLKIRWVTYWFRLQNATLFFYTKKNGSASHLRGYYYIYTVQSVREVQRAYSKHFMFEIIMTNGKRKLLAAETAAFREEWIGHLWQAMHLSTSRVSFSKSTQLEVCEQQRDRTNSSTAICSTTHSDSETELVPARPLSAPAPTTHTHQESRSIDCPIYLPYSWEATYQNILPACSSYQPHNGVQRCSGLSSAEGEGDYDILPFRKEICEINVSTETDMEVYAIPLSCRRSAEQSAISDPTESIYDVPSSLLRKMSDQTLEEQLEDEIYQNL